MRVARSFSISWDEDKLIKFMELCKEKKVSAPEMLRGLMADFLEREEKEIFVENDKFGNATVKYRGVEGRIKDRRDGTCHVILFPPGYDFGCSLGNLNWSEAENAIKNKIDKILGGK